MKYNEWIIEQSDADRMSLEFVEYTNGEHVDLLSSAPVEFLRALEGMVLIAAAGGPAVRLSLEPVARGADVLASAD